MQLFSRYDLVVTPSAAALPWPAAQGFPPTIDGQAVALSGLDLLYFEGTQLVRKATYCKAKAPLYVAVKETGA